MLRQDAEDPEKRHMFPRSLALSIVGCLLLLGLFAPAHAQDAQICLSAADRVHDGDTLADAAKGQAHEACLRALSNSSNVVQKYHLQEADFDIMGTRPKQ
jgi:hypothetical protein